MNNWLSQKILPIHFNAQEPFIAGDIRVFSDPINRARKIIEKTLLVRQPLITGN